MFIGETEGASEADALILGGGRAVPDHDGPPDDAVDAAFEDVGDSAGTHFGARRFRKANRLHRRKNEKKETDTFLALTSRLYQDATSTPFDWAGFFLLGSVAHHANTDPI